MKLTATQLRQIIREELQRVVSETRSYVNPNEVMDAYDDLYMASGAPTLEELAVALGTVEDALTPRVLRDAGLAVDAEGIVAPF